MPRARSDRSTGAPWLYALVGVVVGLVVVAAILDRAELKLTIVGGCGGWPAAGEACSGYLLEHDGFRLLIDPGYAVLPEAAAHVAADQVDAVLVSHGHPDHCADLNPLLRARHSWTTHRRRCPFTRCPRLSTLFWRSIGHRCSEIRIELKIIRSRRCRSPIGPFAVETALLPHPRPNAGFRITAHGTSFAYTGDAGPDSALVALALDADLLLAEASYADDVPADVRGALSSAGDAARQAS